MTRRKKLVLLTLGWLVVGLVGGTAEWFGTRGETGWSWLRTARASILAGVIWIPMTVGALALARRWPPIPLTVRTGTLHLVAAAAATFVLNITFGVFTVVLGWNTAPFTTAVEDAVRAGLRLIHLNAGAYLAIIYIGTLYHRRTAAGPQARVSTFPDTLTVKDGSATLVLTVDDITWIEGADDYARVHTDTGSHLVNERLKRLAARLDPERFTRVHRSAIINLNRLRTVQHRSHGDYDATLEDGTTVRISRTHRDRLSQWLASRRDPIET